MSSSVDQPNKLSATEQLQNIRSKLAWIEQLTRTNEDKLNTTKQEKGSNKFAATIECELISQLDMLQHQTVDYIEKLYQLQLEVDKLHKSMQCFVAAKRRFHFNKIVLDSLGRDNDQQQKLHNDLQKFSQKNYSQIMSQK